MKDTAIIVVDMLNDFVTGSLACERAQRIIPPLSRLLSAARTSGIRVIYSNDSHIPGIDHELELWGEHGMANTPGAEVISELEPTEVDYLVPKRRYSGFFQTSMQLLLTELGIKTVIICGLHAHMCVRHTTADAYQWGYAIIVPTDGVDSFTEEDYLGGLKYLKEVYGAELIEIDELIKRF
ncbi:MAG: cysteine hydrolase [Coriobacteriales bacterium]|jgi:nicotinamidase-related amidase|nr:cysteine hydrolase [Coriobacteriales bacterium]